MKRPLEWQEKCFVPSAALLILIGGQPLVLTGLGNWGRGWRCQVSLPSETWWLQALEWRCHVAAQKCQPSSGGSQYRWPTTQSMHYVPNVKKVLTGSPLASTFLLFVAILRVKWVDFVIVWQSFSHKCVHVEWWILCVLYTPKSPLYGQGPSPQLLLTIFYFLHSNVAFNQTIINSCSHLHICVCFSQEFPKALTSRESWCFSASALC